MPPPFAFGDDMPAGIQAIPAVGHTPGHTAFRIDSGGKSVLIIGDLLHAASLQFPLPDECAGFDMDMPGAVEARKRVLNLAAEKNIPVAGMHIPFTGFGAVDTDGAGFRFTQFRP
jgi:glyoxylase-like metal-dependent hydrolase (beta-lactamase superfamily II)